MSRISSLLQERFKQESGSQKMAQLVQRSTDGSLSSFEGIFTSCELSAEEKASLQALLDQYRANDSSPSQDYNQLCNLTVEIKAITKQAILLHGERIKRAQELLKGYKEGAFSAWLLHAYGNRQTPYNLLLYYEFFHQLPTKTRAKLELLPRQAAYTLASRKGSLQDKIEIIERYKGQTKNELLELIRRQFPLQSNDARRGSHPVISNLRALLRSLNNPNQLPLDQQDIRQAEQLIKACQKLLQHRK